MLHEKIINCSDSINYGEDEGIKYEIDNQSNSTIKRIKVDCVFVDPEHNKCDYIFDISKEEFNTYYFVELKRSGKYDKCIKQLYQTYDNIKRDLKSNASFKFRAVLGKKSAPKNVNTFFESQLKTISNDDLVIIDETEKYIETI